MFNPQAMVASHVASTTLGPPHWQEGICSCTEDMGMCCQTIWCAPCTASNIINKRETGMPQCDCVTMLCILVGTYATNNEYPTWLGMGVRRALIQRYGIQGESTCNTCCLGTCCFACNVCQLQLEMSKRKEHCGGCCATPPPAEGGMMDQMKNAAMKAVGNVVLNQGVHAPGPWGSGVCDCTGGDCIEGLCCVCCVFGYMGSKLDNIHGVAGSAPGTVDPLSCCGSLWYTRAFIYMNRRELIERYNVIGETHLKTLIMTLCCPFCSAIQQRREMGYRGEWPGGLIVKEAPPRK